MPAALPSSVHLVVLRGEPIAYTYDAPVAMGYMSKIRNELNDSKNPHSVSISRCRVRPYDVGCSPRQGDSLWVVVLGGRFHSTHLLRTTAYEQLDRLQSKLPNREIRCVRVPSVE